MNSKSVSVILCLLFMMSASVFAGCISGNCYNGNGTFSYSDGSRYSGTFYKGKPHGQGKYLHRDGSVYTGEFQNGEKNGQGHIRFAGGDEYTGQFAHGTISGKGIMTYRKGDKYDGTWVNGKPSGNGVYTFADGDVYTGQFLDGQFNGKGKMQRADGSYYDGTWIRNKKHGQGVVFQNGKKAIHIYDMNVLTGEKVADQDDESFDTAVAENMDKSRPAPATLKDCTSQYCHNEKGTYRYLDGSVYTGQFVDGEGSGSGKCVYADGSYYEGGWKNHSPHGQGIMHFASGRVYAAIWDNGVPVRKVAVAQSVPKVDNTTASANTGTPAEKPSVRTDADGKVRIFALIVGIATYNHMPSLKYTDDDAYQLYAFFKSPEGGALTDDNIKILIDDAATKQTIMDELKSLSSRADADDVVILYLSGHGLDGAYVPSDFDGRDHQLPYSSVLDELDKSRARHKLFITDACHSGSMIAAARTPLSVAIQNFYNAYNTANGGTAIMTSSKQEEVSLEYGGLRQGVFSHFLIKGLKGYADSSGDKLVTIDELYQYIYNNVRDYTANKQNPSIVGDFDKNMPVGWVR